MNNYYICFGIHAGKNITFILSMRKANHDTIIIEAIYGLRKETHAIAIMKCILFSRSSIVPIIVWCIGPIRHEM